MKIKVFFAWYDFRIGWFYDIEKTRLYIALLPMIIVQIDFIFCYQIIGHYSEKPIGYCWGYEGKKDVLFEESSVSFNKISRKQYLAETNNE